MEEVSESATSNGALPSSRHVQVNHFVNSEAAGNDVHPTPLGLRCRRVEVGPHVQGL